MSARGSRHSHAKLSDHDAYGVRADRRRGDLLKVVARRYGTTEGNVYNIAKGVTWTHLLPLGLCSDRGDHQAHEHPSATLGRFWCTADERDREPSRSERKRS